METRVEIAVVPENKIVVDAPVARRLLKDGYEVVDIKPKKGHPRESIFVFKTVPGFMEKMNEYLSERKEKRANKEEE